MMLPSWKENCTKKKRQKEANRSLAADIKQSVGFWLKIQYRQKSGKKCINYLDKRSFNSNVEGTGRKNHQINCSKQETWVAVVSFWSQWRAWGYSESVMKLAGSTPMAEVLYTNREQTTKTTPPSNRTPHFITVAFELLSCVQLSVSVNCSMLDSSCFPLPPGVCANSCPLSQWCF